MNTQVVGFYRDNKGKIRPITKSLAELSRKKLIERGRAFRGIRPAESNVDQIDTWQEHANESENDELVRSVILERLKARTGPGPLDICEVQANRSYKAKAIDKAKKARLAKNAAQWISAPNRCDLKGIDYPEKASTTEQQEPEKPIQYPSQNILLATNPLRFSPEDKKRYKQFQKALRVHLENKGYDVKMTQHHEP